MKHALALLAAVMATPAIAQPTNFANTGFEANALNNSTVTVAYVTNRAMTLTGYNFSISMAPAGTPPGIFSNASMAEVLFYVTIDGVPPVNDFQAGVIKDFSGKQALHGGNSTPQNAQIAQAIIKAEIGNGGPNTVNVPVALSGFNLPIPAGAKITIWAGHAGWGPIDFEVQGGFTYE
jgi:hypothetical protein